MHTVNGDVLDLLRTLPKPEPPPWLGPQIVAAIAAEERRRQHRRQRIRGRQWVALALGLELLVFALWERTAG